MKKKTVLLILTICIIATVIISILTQHNNTDQITNSGNIEYVVIGVPNWKSAMATAYILRELIRKNTDVQIRLQSGTNEEIYAGILNGTVHIHPEGWTPNHSKWLTHLRDRLEQNKNSTTATQGLCINSALAEHYNITHIKDLRNPGIAQYFDSDGDGKGEIWIGNKRWNTTAIEQIRAKSYGYDTDYELLQTDEATALQRLENATAAEKLFAIRCYTPHWIWSAYNLYRLKEPAYSKAKWNIVHPSNDPQWLEISDATSAWESETLHIYYTKTLKQQHPAVAELLRKTQFTAEELLQITYDMEKGSQDPATYAQLWVAKNR